MRLFVPRFPRSGAVVALLLLSLVASVQGAGLHARGVPLSSQTACASPSGEDGSRKEQKQSLENVVRALKGFKSTPQAHQVSLGKVLFFGLRTGIKLKSGDKWAKGAASAFDGVTSVYGLDYGECSDADRSMIEAGISGLLIESNKVLEDKEGFDTVVAYGALLPDGKTATDVIIIIKDQAVFCLKGKILQTDILRTARRLGRQL